MRTIAYDSDGNHIWSANGTNHISFAWEHPVGLALDSGGRAVVGIVVSNSTCFDTSQYDQSGDMVWNWYLDKDDNVGFGGLCGAVVVDSAGNAYLTGAGTHGSPTVALVTVKLDTSGHKAWRSSYVGPVANTVSLGAALTLDSAGNVYAAGYSPGVGSGNDIVTLKYDNNGNQLWVQRYDGPAHGDDIPPGIVVDNQGGVYVTGYSATTNGGTEFVTIKYAEQNVKRNNDGSIQLTFFSAPGQTSAFYGSTDFLTWSNLGTAIADTNGLAQFTDTNAPLFNYRFYKRTVLP